MSTAVEKVKAACTSGLGKGCQCVSAHYLRGSATGEAFVPNSESWKGTKLGLTLQKPSHAAMLSNIVGENLA